MDKEYICPKLKNLSLLFYGKDCKPFAKEKKKMYIFGSKKHKIKNIVSKPVAIYLIIGNIKTNFK
jgi:hypothetical protein